MTNTLTCPELSEVTSSTPDVVVRNIMGALKRRDIEEATNHFSERFTFVDHALAFTFTDKEGLNDFLLKAVQILQESTLEVDAITVCGNLVTSEWTLSGVKDHDFGVGFRRRTRVAVNGVSVARLVNGEVVSWADYYDSIRSWRFSLAGLYADY